MLFSQSYNLLPTAMNTEGDSSPPSINLDFLDLDINDSSPPEFNTQTLLGKLISDKPIPFKSIKYILLNAWNLGSHIRISHIEQNLVACRFTKDTDRDRIFNSSPWAVKRHILSMKKWDLESTFDEIAFHLILF